ncbi:FAD-dependent oxidoreductase [Streptomyces sp. NPDC048191]|uniref:NAD(P)/FAD-dependent oxidoreductase n=1 Tax=Streptomyces sp. NPDC048191 TaxID=3155484 RepID=UPI0033F95EA8
MVHVAVLGGGISGLAAGLFLGRQGHRVTVLEREPRSASADLDSDFLHWKRPRSPHALQPHLLLAPVRTILRDLAPDVYATMLEHGAVELHELAHFEPFQARAGDEDLVTVRTRRIVLEAALAQAVRAEPTVEVRTSVDAKGLITLPGAVPHVIGLRTKTGEIHADLVIDAAGRRSPVPRWLTCEGSRPPQRESHHTGIAYFSRWYRLRSDTREMVPAVLGETAPFAECVVFPSDNGYFGVALIVSVADPTRGSLRAPQVFDAAAKTFAGGADWLSRNQRPMTPVHVMAGLDNQWTALVDEHGPQVTGLINLGDSALHTNPTFAQGIPLALRAAQWLTAHDLADPDLPTTYHQWRVVNLKPWFDAQTAADQAYQQGLRAGLHTAPPHQVTGDALLKAALPFCARDDLHIARAGAQVRHLIRTPEQLLATRQIRDRVHAWLREHPDFDGRPAGPTRTRWEQATNGRGTAGSCPL